jgi:anaerobic selenocysteine-containing dehydrogenase
LSHDRLRDAPGIQWPCTDDAPDGTERLYADGVFNTDPDTAETYGQDLVTGAPATAEEYRAKQPRGRAFLHAADYDPSPEAPGDEYPLLLTTGRTLPHFHTRTKTGRAPELQAAAPEVWVELSVEDAQTAGVADGDLVRVRSPRGVIEGPARVTGIRPGLVFVPFHYGYWDAEGAEHRRAANELTITSWDPVSKQPMFKLAAVALERAG